jgi:succinate dehydrogenase/fumarate reductase flavoprotein subunit
MDKGPVQVWLTSVVSLLAAVVGGWIAGRYAVHAQKHAVKEQRQSDLEAERRAVNGTLQAIKPELEVFNTELVGELKRKFGDWDMDKRARFGERRLRPKRRGLKTVRGRYCDNEPF